MRKLLSVLLVVMLLVPALAFAEADWNREDLTWKQNKEPATFSMFMNMTWAPMDVWGSDHVSIQVTEDTGISFEVTKSQGDEHLPTMIASGELPDAVFVFGPKNIDLLENELVCYPWDELIAEYAPEFMDFISEDEIALATKEDGHFYTLYTHVRNQEYWDDPTQGVTYGQTALAFRDDIMEEIGNPEINSVEDFYNVLKTVKEKYPDMVPYLQQELNADFIPFSFGIQMDATQGMADITEEGKARFYAADKQAVTDYLTFNNKLLREGLLSQEGLTYTFEQAKSALLGGNVFCWSGQAFDIDQVNKELDGLEGEEKLYYTALRKPLTVDGDMRYHTIYANPGFAGFYITRACKDPGRLIALMEYMKSPYADKLTQWGVEGLDYEMVNGYPIQKEEYSWKERGDNVWYFQATFATENTKAMAKAAQDERFGQVANLVIDFKPYWSYDVALAMCKNPVSGTELGDIKSSLEEIKKQYFASSIIAPTEEECQKQIEELFTQMDKAGLEKYNAFIDEQYQAQKAKLAQ